MEAREHLREHCMWTCNYPFVDLRDHHRKDFEAHSLEVDEA